MHVSSPSWELYVPAKHFEQVPPFGANEPMGQGVHATDPSWESVPGRHDSHEVDKPICVLNVPGGQGMH